MTGEMPGGNVSRETSEQLDRFEALLRRWNPRINLVSKTSLTDLRTRHTADSLQLYDLAPPGATWCDLGSGGGFPGLIVAIASAARGDKRSFTLIESDQRKSAFLRTAVRELGLACAVLSQRIEIAQPQNADVLSARALADLPTLLFFAERHLAPGGTALFPKGATWKKELEDARRQWSFEAEAITSKTEPTAAILKINGVTRV